MSDKFLAGRVAMVTGGASGMGKAMALAFAGAGAEVAIGSLLAGGAKAAGEVAYLPGADELEQARSEIEALGVHCLASGLDVADDGSAQDRMIKHVLSGMIEGKWGRIINIASTAASVGAETSGAYCASKAGVVGLTRCVALEGAKHGVTCNAISPTWVETRFGTSWMANIAEEQEGRSGAAYIADAKAANPQGRLIQPGEIGALAAFLCRDEALGITMQDLTVSAGSLW